MLGMAGCGVEVKANTGNNFCGKLPVHGTLDVVNIVVQETEYFVVVASEYRNPHFCPFHVMARFHFRDGHKPVLPLELFKQNRAQRLLNVRVNFVYAVSVFFGFDHIIVVNAYSAAETLLLVVYQVDK